MRTTVLLLLLAVATTFQLTAQNASDYRAAAEQGYAEAQYNLGVCYENGYGVTKDLTQAVYWYKKAAGQGLATAQFNLGVCYTKGEEVEQDDTQAAYWYKKAAEQGYADAQYFLGLCYHGGDGVEKNETQAVYWYKKAAEQGVAEAQYNLGIFYYSGQGVEENKNTALYWLEKITDKSKLSVLQIRIIDFLMESLKKEGYTAVKPSNVKSGNHVVTYRAGGALTGFRTYETDNSSRPSTNSAQTTDKITGKIEDVYVELVKKENQTGVMVRVKFSVNNMLNKQGRCVAYFYTENGEKLKDLNGNYCTVDGQVCIGDNVTPDYTNSEFPNYILFLPIDELHVTKKDKDDISFRKIKVSVSLLYDGNRIAGSDYKDFQVLPK